MQKKKCQIKDLISELNGSQLEFRFNTFNVEEHINKRYHGRYLLVFRGQQVIGCWYLEKGLKLINEVIDGPDLHKENILSRIYRIPLHDAHEIKEKLSDLGHSEVYKHPQVDGDPTHCYSAEAAQP